MHLLDNYKVITVTHHNLNVSEIGNFYIHPKENKSSFDVLQRLKSEELFEECLYLETCNRVCYLIFGDFDLTDNYLSSFFSKVNPQLTPSTLQSINKFVTAYEGEDAIKHIYELASSMDSLVVGEREIFRQLRTAFDKCKEENLIGDNLRLLEKSVVTTAKDIYSSTKIGEKSLSIVSLAISEMLSKVESKDQNVLLVGAGETNALVGKFLMKYQFNNVAIYNRSIHNANELSHLMNAPAFHLNELANTAHFDIIIICTSANKVVIDQSLYSKMLKGDTNPKMIIDLAVPRNVSQAVVENNNVEYIDIESLKKRSEENLEFRKSELEKAKPLIRKHLKSFKSLYQQRHLEKALSHVPSQVKDIKAKAVEVVFKKRIDELDDKSKELVEEMLAYMEKKFISVPMKSAKNKH